jgi:hypothetical protein
MVWVVLRNHITLKLTKVVNAPRNIPAGLKKKIKETLKEMEEKRVIRKVDEPTDWVNSLVVVKKPKSDKLRVCLDPRSLNVAIKRWFLKTTQTIEYFGKRFNWVLFRFHCHDYLYKSQIFGCFHPKQW